MFVFSEQKGFKVWKKKKGFKNDVFKYIENKILNLYTNNIYNYQQKNS